MRILRALVIATVLGIATPALYANNTAVFTGLVGTEFNYALNFTVDQPGEQLRPGDFITIYDVGPMVAITSATAPAGFSVALNNLGNTPAGLVPPAIVDDPTLANVTFTYIGAAQAASFNFTGAQIEMDPSYTATAFGIAAGTTSFNVQGDQRSTNITTVPAQIPEPATLGPLSLAAVPLLVRRRR